uniref:hypothetical protein n=1 Tax=Streptococcus canis TaxID=1329 RepID=UPI0024DE0E37
SKWMAKMAFLFCQKVIKFLSKLEIEGKRKDKHILRPVCLQSEALGLFFFLHVKANQTLICLIFYIGIRLW